MAILKKLLLGLSFIWGAGCYGSNLNSSDPGIMGLKAMFGQGRVMDAGHKTERYLFLKRKSMEEDFPLQWIVGNLSKKEILAESGNPNLNFYGASVTKPFVAAAALDFILKNKAEKSSDLLPPALLKKIIAMITVSDNRAWKQVQRNLGDGNEMLGRQRVYSFAQKQLQLQSPQVFSGWLNSIDERPVQIHGNETNVRDLWTFLLKTKENRYGGAALLWDIMFATRTGTERGLKYLPKAMPVGGKTGSYSGPTVHAPSQKPYQARINHHFVIFPYQEQFYTIIVLTDLGSSEDVALMVGGLFQEYIHHKKVSSFVAQ